MNEILNNANYVFNPYAVPPGLTACLTLLLGVAAVIKEGCSLVSRTFLGMTATTFIWLSSFSLMYCAKNREVALWWAKFAYIGIAFIPTSVYTFTASVLKLPRQRKRLCYLFLGLSLLFLMAVLKTDKLISGLHHYWWGPYPKYGGLGVLYLTFFLGITILSLSDFRTQYRKARPGSLHYLRVRALFIAFVTVYLGSIDFLPKFGIAIYPVGYLPVLVFMALVAYTIARYQLKDITPTLAAQQILNTMTNALIVIDQDKMIQLINPSTTTLLGYREKELVGKPVTDLLKTLTHANSLEFDALTNPSCIGSWEATLTAKNGDSIPVILSMSLLENSHLPIGTVIIAHDARELKSAERKLRKAYDELELKVYDRTKELEKINTSLREEIMERKNVETRLTALLAEKELLLREIHHRVKNNLQVISSLLNLQSKYIKEPEDLKIFTESRDRVRAMALIHGKLYQSNNLSKLDFTSYIQSLCEYLFRTYGANPNHIRFKINADQTRLEIDSAIIAGLIVTELVSNSLKHAFSKDAQRGEIHVDLKSHIPDNKVILSVKDSGSGFPENIDFRNTDSLGLQLVNTLVEQMGGTLELHRKGGTEFRISFLTRQPKKDGGHV